MNINRITKNKHIFKYMPIDKEGYTFKTLENNELFFSIPAVVNDPFDCKFNLIVNPSIEGAENFYNSLKLSEDEKLEKLKLFEKDKTQIKIDIENDYTKRLRQEFGITCFSERKDSILLWSHYADKFKGICLGFDWKVDEQYFQGYKVNYDKKLPEVFYDGNGRLEIKDIFLTKLKWWKYEKEVRSIVHIDNGTQLDEFNPKALKSIIFGERINSENKEIIKKIVEENQGYKNVKYFTTITDKNSLKVNIHQIH